MPQRTTTLQQTIAVAALYGSFTAPQRTMVNLVVAGDLNMIVRRRDWVAVLNSLHTQFERHDCADMAELVWDTIDSLS